MTYHPSQTWLFEDLKPEDLIDGELLDAFRESVLHDLGRMLAYAITGYADWLHYTCVRYIEQGGWPDLSHIEKYITWPDDIDYDTRKRVIDNIYHIIQPIVIDAQHYKKVPDHNGESKIDIGKAIDWMIEIMPKEKMDKMCEVIGRAMKIMEEGMKEKERNPHTDGLINLMKKAIENESR